MNEVVIFGVGVGVTLIVGIGVITSQVFAGYKKQIILIKKQIFMLLLSISPFKVIEICCGILCARCILYFINKYAKT